MISIKPFLKKINRHWDHFKLTNSNKRFLLLQYLAIVIIYRRILCYLLAIPLFFIYCLIYPFIKLRFIRLVGSALGHYAVNTENILCELDAIGDRQFINVFYLEHSPFESFISNKQLHKMWKREISILPLWFTPIVTCIDKFIMFFLSRRLYGLNGKKKYVEHRGVGSREINGYFKNTNPHLSFTNEEHTLARVQLDKLGIKQSDKYICLLVRSSAYKKGHPTWNMPERNADLHTYWKACQYLAEKGYYVLRMGKEVDDTFPSLHQRILDYARSEIRSDFMDIYLSANCYFFITTGSGLDGIAQIFRRPILYTNCFLLPYIATWYPHQFFTLKNVRNKKSGKLISFKEQAYMFLRHPDWLERKSFHVSNFIKKHELEFIDNTEDELLNAVIEMESWMVGAWNESEAAKDLQAKFWKIFPKYASDIDTNMALHGDINIRLGASFLVKYKELLDDSSN